MNRLMFIIGTIVLYVKNFPMTWEQFLMACAFISFTLSLVIYPLACVDTNTHKDSIIYSDWQDIEDDGDSPDTTLTSRGHFECMAIGQCTVLNGGGKVKHFANWSGEAPGRPAAIDNVKEEWYRTARNRGCTKDFEIFLVSCQ